MGDKVFLLQTGPELHRWEQTLSRLGVESCDIKRRNGSAAGKGRSGGILLADRALLGRALPAPPPGLAEWIGQKRPIVVTGPPSSDTFPFPVEELTEGHDPMAINRLLLRHLSGYSRQLPRVEIKLPALYASTRNHHLCEILNLSPAGAFIRTGIAPPSVGTEIRLHIALLGLRKELELDASIVRHVVPREENNYQQGFGVKFVADGAFPGDEIHDYLRLTVGAPFDGDGFPPHQPAGSSVPGSDPAARRDLKLHGSFSIVRSASRERA